MAAAKKKASSKKSSGAKKSQSQKSQSNSLWVSNKVTMFCLIVLSWIIGLIVLFSFGLVGRFGQEVLQLLVGSFSYVLILTIMFCGLVYLLKLGEFKIPNRIIAGYVFFAVFWVLAFGLAQVTAENPALAMTTLFTDLSRFSTNTFSSTCGLAGASLAYLFSSLFSRAGALMFDLAFLFTGAILMGWKWWKYLIISKKPSRAKAPASKNKGQSEEENEEGDRKKSRNPYARLKNWAASDPEYQAEQQEDQRVLQSRRKPRTPYGVEEEEMHRSLMEEIDSPQEEEIITPAPHSPAERLNEMISGRRKKKKKKNAPVQAAPEDEPRTSEVFVQTSLLDAPRMSAFDFLEEENDDLIDDDDFILASSSSSGGNASRTPVQDTLPLGDDTDSNEPEESPAEPVETPASSAVEDAPAQPVSAAAETPALETAAPAKTAPASDSAVPEQKKAAEEKPASKTEEENASSKKTEKKSESEDHPDFSHYSLPPVNLLQEVRTKKKTSANIRKAKEQGVQLIEILQQFGVEATLGEIHIGPSVTEFEVIPGQGVRVSAFTNLQSDIKLALAAKDIRVEAPIPGKSAVGIEVPNEEKTTVSMKELITAVPEKLKKQPLVFTLGKDLMGENVYGRLDTMPHLLIAGATGSGKSVCVNSIICSLLLRTKPDEVKLLLVDPKKVEFTPYNGIPHLLSPVITDPALASGALKVIVDVMDERYSRFEELRVRNIAGYNEYVRKHPKEEREPMPRIVVIIDELADLMLAASKDVEQSIQRITQLARAAGIHLIVATQRPSVNVITGVIKANIPSRIAFMVSSRPDSRTILDQSGAEKLLGYGDMLFMDNGASSPRRIQGVFIQDQEVEAICEYVRKQASPDYDEMFLALKESNHSVSDDDSFEEDPLYNEVRNFVIVSGKASTSLIQRRFRIGYGRAARILDQLEANRIIGPAQGTRPRQILVPVPEDDEDLN